MKETADHSLRRVLKCLQHDWIHDFVFHNQDQLLYQSLVQNVHLLGQYTVQTSSELPIASVADVNERGAMLFVCADTKGALTTGFEIMHREQTASKVLLHDRYITRIVRDDDLGILLSIAQLPGLPLIEVSYCALVTPGFREHAFILFHTDQFREMLNKYPDRFDHDAAKRAMQYRFFASEWRNCPNCASKNSHNCGCLLNLTRKSSPFDLAREITNLSAHGGAYDGIANITSAFMAPSGQPLHSKVCRMRSEVKALSDEAQRVKMSQWALSTLSNRNPVSLTRMRVAGDDCDSVQSIVQHGVLDECTSRFSLDLGDPVGAIDDFLGAVRGELDLNALRVSGILDELEKIEDSATQSKRRDRAAICWADVMGTDAGGTALLNIEDEDVNSSISSLVDRALANDGAGEQQRCTESMYVMFAQGMMQSGGANVRSAATAQCTVASNVRSNAMHAEEAVARALSIAPTGGAGMGIDTLEVLTGNENGTNSVRVETGEVNVRSCSRKGSCTSPVRIAPARSAESGESEKVDARAVKLELRKARNRASAQRSNLKKKMALQKLKDDLSSMSQREQQLRERERLLRQENLKLRAAVCL